MKALLCVCFIAVFFVSADGKLRNDSELCGGKEDFTLCSEEWTCNVNLSRCYCKSEIPFCRCNNHIDEFYLGSKCSVKFTKATFILVATLPGLALALLSGLCVHLIHFYTKSSRSHGSTMSRRLGGISKIFKKSGQNRGKLPAEGFSFESDLKPSSNFSPPGPVQPRMDIPKATTAPPKPPSAYDNIQSPPTTKPVKGLPHPAYSAPDNPPLQSPLRASFRTPGSSQPYSYKAGVDQVLSNPYTTPKNPYEERSPSSPNPYDDDKKSAPPSSSYLPFPRPQITGT